MEPTVLIENQCSGEKIASIYLPIIDDAITGYHAIFGACVLNIRLLGSVARSEANPHSDIDFVAVVRTTPSEEQLRQLADREQDLQRQYPFVSKVDLEAVSVNGLARFRQFIFATDSVSLFGSDLYTRERQTWDRQQLAALITPDLDDIVTSYRNGVERADEDNRELLCFYSRLIGKDILKCLRCIALLHGGEYERNIGRIYNQLLQYAPEVRGILHELYELYVHPSHDRQKLLRVLHDVETISPALGDI
jgi:predicted nucleotidyltransferase